MKKKSLEESVDKIFSPNELVNLIKKFNSLEEKMKNEMHSKSYVKKSFQLKD